VSYGTHFFQDLVEADIAIMPLYPDTKGSSLNEAFLLGSRNAITDVDAGLAALSEVIRVIHVPSILDGKLLHVFLDAESQKGIGMFGPATGSGRK
jgi:pyruvate,water dikinase